MWHLSQCHWHHMMKKFILTSFQFSWLGKCSGSIDDSISIIWCWHLTPMASHNEESDVTSDYNCLDLRNAMVPQIMVLALCNAGVNDVIWPKEACCLSSQLSLPKEISVAIYDAVAIMWQWCWSKWHYVTPTSVVSCDASASGNCVIRPKKSCCIYFLLPWPKEWNGDIENADSTMWC